jgi:hypothetical protein
MCYKMDNSELITRVIDLIKENSDLVVSLSSEFNKNCITLNSFKRNQALLISRIEVLSLGYR